MKTLKNKCGFLFLSVIPEVKPKRFHVFNMTLQRDTLLSNYTKRLTYHYNAIQLSMVNSVIHLYLTSLYLTRHNKFNGKFFFFFAHLYIITCCVHNIFDYFQRHIPEKNVKYTLTYKRNIQTK